MAEGGFVNAWRTDSKMRSRPGLSGNRSMAASIAAACLLSGLALSTSLEQHSTHVNEYVPLSGRCFDDSHCWQSLINFVMCEHSAIIRFFCRCLPYAALFLCPCFSLRFNNGLNVCGQQVNSVRAKQVCDWMAKYQAFLLNAKVTLIRNPKFDLWLLFAFKIQHDLPF